MDWRSQVQQLGPAEGRQQSALERIDTLLAGEAVSSSVMAVRRDVCDDGHIHADLSVWLLTQTRLLSLEVNDAHHVEAPTVFDGTRVHTVQVPLRAVEDVQLNTWLDPDGDPVGYLSVSHLGGRGGGVLTPHECDDPACDEVPGTLYLESWSEALELHAAGNDTAALPSFAGALGIAAANR